MSRESQADLISHAQGGEDAQEEARILGERVETLLFTLVSGLSAIVVAMVWVALSLR